MLKLITMDDIFKKKLTDLRNPPKPKSFGEALLNPGNWSLQPLVKKTVKPVILHEEYSEKVQIIESLERFAEEKVKETAQPVIKVEGGEISLKPDPVWDDIPVAQDFSELAGFLTLPDQVIETLLSGKEPGEINILFVTENFHQPEAKSAPRVGFQNELQYCFPTKTVEFFEKMVNAMKLPLASLSLYPIEKDGEDLSEEVMAVAGFLRPKVIVTLGAKAAHGILKNNDRLSTFQSQFFKRSAGELGIFTIVPLYHPTIIETNPNMKKLTWEGMQKIMAYLKNPS